MARLLRKKKTHAEENMIFLITFSLIADCRDVVSTKYRVILHTYVLDRNLQKANLQPTLPCSPTINYGTKWVLDSHPLDNSHEGLTNSWSWTSLFLHYWLYSLL